EIDFIEVKKIAYKYAIKNAFEHKSKAQIGAVVGKVKALFPEVDLSKAMPSIKEEVDKVNSLNETDLENEYNKFNESGFELKQVEKEKTLPELNWLKEGEKLITRSAPCPTGAMHFGHARPYILTDEYVKKYGGKYIMRFDDTDPKVKIPEKEMYQEFLNDFNWLGIKIDSVSNQSDHLNRYYEIIERLIEMNQAYICSCEGEVWKDLIWKSKPCPCREKSIDEQKKEWQRMLNHEIKEGQAVVRLKTDLTSKDSSLRDYWIAKVVDDPTKHPNVSTHDKHVWPSYNLASAVDDHDMNINFIIRGQEHIANEEKQKILYSYFNWTYPHTMYHGKISKLGDMVLSKSKMKIIMEKEGILRYDDPRMSTIKAFKRRGILPETIRKIINACGIGISEVKIEMDMIAAFNKQFLGQVNQYPFFEEAAEIEIINCINGTIENNGEKINITSPIQKFLINKNESKEFNPNEKYRLRNAFNIKINDVNEFSVSSNFISYEKIKDIKSIDWIRSAIDVDVLMSDGKTKSGLSTISILKEQERNEIQLNGIGFVNIEKLTTEKVYCVFSHI
ncbi:MAG: glutamate--tRNA ligase family protein, partial [Candidatus ainarchaeum sp.]|nr:glutamate--tRNA ligase family protein [Candidatus ainarchaeum sp.]